MRQTRRGASRGVVGYPLLVKAVAGGGGKACGRSATRRILLARFARPRSEAGAAFGDAAVYIERRLMRPRHVEVQLLADEHGTVVPFVERECSMQRRHQKVVEETPSVAVTPALRQSIAAQAASVAREVGYTNAGTMEFLLDEDGRSYFLEMNTRLQVEHAITEMVTGVDLVRWQIRIARGERLDLDADRMLTPVGHAMECRIYAEDPDNGFDPLPGRITSSGPRPGRGYGTKRRHRGPRRSELLRPDDLEGDGVGGGPPDRDRAHASRAGGIPDRGNQDDSAVLHVAAGPA